MKPFVFRAAMAAVLFALVLFVAAAGQIPAERNPVDVQGVMAVLSPGMAVTLGDKGGRYEIGVLKGFEGPLSHKVVEVTETYVVLTDVPGIRQTRIPIYSLACITVTDPGP